MFKRKVTNRGFTLIELLVSISLFTFVGLVAMASLVATQQMNSSLKATRNLYDNMYFTMDEIGRELRQGRNYRSEDAKQGISFIPYDSNIVSTLRVKYSLKNGVVYKYKESAPDTANFISEEPITNDKIKITYLTFDLLGNDGVDTGNRQQPSVKIKVRGQNQEKPYVEFDLENFITQRDTRQ